MLRWKMFRFRLKSTPRAERLFAQFAGCCRYVYNRALALNKERVANGGRRLAQFDMSNLLPVWKREPDALWLSEAPAQSLQQVLRDLERAYANYSAGRAGAPRFKKKGKSPDSFRCPKNKGGLRVDTARGLVMLPKVGWVRYFNPRPLDGTVKNATVWRRCGKWYVSIQVEQDVTDPVHPAPEAAVGVDAGVTQIVALSTGELVPPLNALRAVGPKMRRLQRSLSRKVKFSSNWKKAKGEIAKLHSRAANRRNDHLHKLTTRLCKNHATIVVENLRVMNMTRSARGTVKKPGKKVRQKSGLNKSILDQGWGEMVRQLGYKCAWGGGRLVKVNAAYTSQTCHRCGLTDSANRKSQAAFACLWCGWEGNADINAAKVILAAGLRRLACGGVSEAGGLPPVE